MEVVKGEDKGTFFLDDNRLGSWAGYQVYKMRICSLEEGRRSGANGDG